MNEEVERKLSSMQKAIQLGRTARDLCNVTLKTPLRTLVVIADPHITADVESLKNYILEELNVREVIVTSNERDYNIQLEAKVDWPVLGKKLKKNVKVVRDALPKLSQEELRSYSLEKKITVGGIELGEGDLTIIRVLRKDRSNMAEEESKWEPGFADDMIVLLDATIYPDLTEEGLARDILSRIQKLRKKAGLTPTDDVAVQYSVRTNPEEIDVPALVSSRHSLFTQSLRGQVEHVQDIGPIDNLIMEEEQAMGSLSLLLRLVKV